MPRSSSYNPSLTINFQTDKRMHDALHAVARQQERSASAVIRLAVRAYLDTQAVPSATTPQQAPASGRAPSTLPPPRTERRATAEGRLCLNAAARAVDTPPKEKGPDHRPDPY
jgi:hypothetical protein